MAGNFYTCQNYGPRSSIGYLVRRLHKLGLGRLEAVFEDLDVSFTQWAVLLLIRHEIADTASGLARGIGHDSGAMTRVLDHLEGRGLLRRSRDMADRRVVKIELTDAGEEMAETLRPLVVEIWNEVLDGIDREEVRAFIATLTRIVDRFEALETIDDRDADNA